MPIKKYLAKFRSTSDYNTFAESDDYITPNVSAIYGSNIVFYNPYVHDYSKDYLTFEAIESGIFAFTNPINYSIDDGETWVALSANTNTPTINVGDKILWKTSELTPSYNNGIGKFSSTGEFNVMGNVMSLLYGDNFIGKVNLTGKDYAFRCLFYECSKLISAEKLSLPATTLASMCYNYMFLNCTSLITAPSLAATTLASCCYQGMFQSCTSLTIAPKLPATRLSDGSYSNMFYGCRSLNSITMLATNISSPGCLHDWVKNVSASGTFIKEPSMTSLPTGENGIPSGWTVQDYVAS